MNKFLFICAMVSTLAIFSCKTPTNAPSFHVSAPDKRGQCNISDIKALKGQDKYTVLVFGDQGSGASAVDPNYVVGRAMAKICAKRKCDFAIGLGDNFYPGGVSGIDDPQFISKFEVPYKDLQFPFYMSLGNHDYHHHPEAQIQYKSERWNMPCAYYPIRNLPSWLNIFALDTFKLDNEQIVQAKRALCGKPGWKMLFGHHPLYSNGSSHGDTPFMKELALPMIKECGVQIVLSGHDHDQEHITSADIEQFVQGSAGKQRKIQSGVKRDGLIQKFATSAYGFAIFEISSTSLEVDYYNNQADSIYHFSKVIQ
jgi:acid phosphatase